MARELKFRTWNWLEGRYDKNPCAFLTISGELTPSANRIVEQYTELKDKNGKEIYDGDIVNVIGIGIAQVIDSPRGEWMLYYKREPDEIKNGFACVVPKNKPSGLWKTNITSYIEVIGNIHENPELLEGA